MKDPNEIVLHVGTTRTWIQILPSNPWAPVIREITKQKLSDYEFDPRWKRYKVNKRYLWYNNKKNRLYIPVNVTPFIRDSLENLGAPFIIKNDNPVKPREMNVHLKPGVEPKPHQVEVIKYLTQLKPYRKGIALQTGMGKTFCSIAAAVQMKAVTLVQCSGLTRQWVDAIFQFTDAKPEDVYEVKGFPSLFDLLASDLKPAFIVFSLETLRMYASGEGNYAELPSFEKFQEYFGIRFCVNDEVHLNFHCTCMIDLHKNIENNAYLSGTFMSNNVSTRRVFNMIYPIDMQYHQDGVQKYIRGVCIKYYGNVPEKATRRLRGYFHTGMENWLLKHPKMLAEYFQRIIQPVFHSYYVNYAEKDEKALIYFNTIQMIEWVQKELQALYPDLKIIKFIGGVPNKAMEEADVGITNTKRAGTGVDIPMLRTVINTVSLKAPALVEQLRGRLRRLKSGNTPVYVELVDMLNSFQMRHLETRRLAHQRACTEFEEIIW